MDLKKIRISRALVFGSVVVLLCGFLLLQKNMILFHWQLRQLQHAENFDDKFRSADYIAKLVEDDTYIATAVISTIKDKSFPQSDKSYLIAALFASKKRTAEWLDQLLLLFSTASCNNAELIGHAALNSFQHGLNTYGWAFYDLAEKCSVQCQECLITTFSILSDLPASEVDLGLQKMRRLARKSDSAERLASVLYEKWQKMGLVEKGKFGEHAPVSPLNGGY